MIQIDSLANLQVGERARVASLLSRGSMRRRLQDIGLIEGTEVECVQKALQETLWLIGFAAR